jgi:hypothetical protein
MLFHVIDDNLLLQKPLDVLYGLRVANKGSVVKSDVFKTKDAFLSVIIYIISLEN